MDMVLFSDMFGPVCLANVFALMIFDTVIGSLCKIDLYERSTNRKCRIYPGKWSFLFFTYAEEKNWYPKKSIILQLVTHFFFLTTLVFSIISIFLDSYITPWISMGLLMLSMLFSGYINNMGDRNRPRY